VSEHLAGRGSLSEQLFHFALSYPAEEMPRELIDSASLRMVDTVGIAVACAEQSLGTAAMRLVMSEPSAGRSSIWASGGRLASSRDACLANGMIAHGMDFDDTHTRTTMHPSIVIVPAALAVGEEVGASGTETLAAAVIGYEISARLGLLASGAFQVHGFHPTSALGIFGAVAVASRLFGVTPAEAVSAAGLAGSMASGLMEYLSDGSSAKQMHPGWAASAAVTAVKLATLGATGPRLVLEGRNGVFRSFADTEVDISEALKDLGRKWRGQEVATKPYPACHCVHAPVDAWRQLRDRMGWDRRDVARVRRIVGLVPPWYPQLVCDPLPEKQHPRSVYEARFSLPFSLALVVVDGQIAMESYAEERLHDERLLAVAERVDFEIRDFPEFPEAYPGGIRVEFEDGASFEELIKYNRGSLGNPMSADEICAKYADCVTRSIDEPRAKELLDALLEMPDEPDLNRFTRAISTVGS
jgi:2-methylcitrate dehydratase PrpD